MLARQLLIGFLAVILPSTVVLGAVTFYSLSSLDRVTDELVEFSRSHERVTDLNMVLNQIPGPLGAFLLGGDPRHRQRFENLVQTAEARLESCATASCHGSKQTPASMAMKLKPAIDQLKIDGRLIFETRPGEGAGRVAAVRGTVAGVRRVMAPMLVAVKAQGEEFDRQVDAVRKRAWLLTEALSGAIVLAGAAAALVISRRLSRPLNDLLFGIRRVTAGDWSQNVRTTEDGEIGELAATFNAMVQELRARRKQVEEYTRTLEERVCQRTEELHQKETALTQSEKLASLGLLAAGVAHELNNPLTSIVMNANLMIEDMGEAGDTHLCEALRKIDVDAARCRRIIEDLRAFARVPQVERVLTEVGTVVDQALSSSAHELDRRNVVVHRDIAPDLPKIAWDPSRMVQVLTNLLMNAAQAIDEAGRHIVIRARRDQDWLRLEVEDDGSGIPAAVRARIFDPFFTTKSDGTGLGLSISHGIVTEHGGRIEVESRTREDAGPVGSTGTTIRVIVPIAEVAG